MTYDLSWQIQDKVIYLRITEKTTFPDYPEINQQILDMLNRVRQAVYLILDLSAIKPTTLPWDQLRLTQRYTEHMWLKHVLIIGNPEDRLLRLMMLVLFNMSTAQLNFYKSLSEARDFLKLHSLVINLDNFSCAPGE